MLYPATPLDYILKKVQFPVLTIPELLELTAKAAGIRIAWGMVPEDKPYICGLGKSAEPTYWHPILDDGDALRLAAQLGILFRKDFLEHLKRLLNARVDRFTATRLAIVLTVVGMQMELDSASVTRQERERSSPDTLPVQAPSLQG